LTHIAHLPGGTPWRYPTSYLLDIGHIGMKSPCNTVYPDGSQWTGLPFATTSDAYFATTMNGWFSGNRPDINNPDRSNLWNEAVVRTLDKIGGQSVDMGSNIGEGRQALRMMADPCISVWKAMKAFKRGEFPEVARQLGLNFRRMLSGRIPANLWLAYQFGWKPLLKDAKAAYDSFGTVTKKDLLVSAGHTAHRTQQGTESFNANWKGDYNTHHRAKCRIDAVVNIPELVQANQWNLINPLSVAWELMPWSFAIDWFVPIGNVLEACSAKAGLTFVSGSVTELSEGTEICSGKYFPPTVSIRDPGEYMVQKFCMRRTPLYSFPTPLPYTKQNPFTSTHIADALALWRQMPGLR